MWPTAYVHDVDRKLEWNSRMKFIMLQSHEGQNVWRCTGDEKDVFWWRSVPMSNVSSYEKTHTRDALTNLREIFWEVSPTFRRIFGDAWGEILGITCARSAYSFFCIFRMGDDRWSGDILNVGVGLPRRMFASCALLGAVRRYPMHGSWRRNIRRKFQCLHWNCSRCPDALVKHDDYSRTSPIIYRTTGAWWPCPNLCIARSLGGLKSHFDILSMFY